MTDKPLIDFALRTLLDGTLRAMMNEFESMGERRGKQTRKPQKSQVMSGHDALRSWQRTAGVASGLTRPIKCPSCLGTGNQMMTVCPGLERPVTCEDCAGRGVREIEAEDAD
jgi:DnaJ-class molecular chaperone